MKKTTLPVDSAERKAIPLYRGPLRYFPAALAGVARVCEIGNRKHNPGEEMHHARGKSADHADCILRHLVDMAERDGLDESGLAEVDMLAWRALALAQEWHEKHGAPLAPGARLPVAAGSPELAPEERGAGRVAPADLPGLVWLDDLSDTELLRDDFVDIVRRYGAVADKNGDVFVVGRDGGVVLNRRIPLRPSRG